MATEDVFEWEDRTGRGAPDELVLEYAVPIVKPDCSDCRMLFGRDREAAEAAAGEHGGVIELRLSTPWRPA